MKQQTADLVTQNRSLKALNQVAHAVSHSMEIDAILDNALSAAVAAVNADTQYEGNTIVRRTTESPPANFSSLTGVILLI